MTGKVEGAVSKTNELLTNRRTRSIIMLFISIFFILGINSLLPVVQGQTHYTADAIEVTYGEFIDMRRVNPNYSLAWVSEKKIELYVMSYIASHPTLSEEEKLLVTAPDTMNVQVYTKFFFQYPFWYISTATSLGSAIILYYTLFNYLVAVGKEKDRKYVELEKQVDEMTDKLLDPVTFEPWMHDEFNKGRKINQHKSNVKYSIEQLERRTPYDIKRVFKPYFELIKTDSDKAKEYLSTLGKLKRRQKKYLKTKEMLLSHLDDTYINEYVVNGRVKHFKYIYPMFVYNGDNGVGKTVDSYSLMKDDGSRLVSEAGSKVLMSVIITVLFAVLFTVTAVSSYQQEPFWIVVNAVSKIAPLFIQIPMAIDYHNHFMKDQLIHNLLARRSIGLLYLASMRKEIPAHLKAAVESK